MITVLAVWFAASIVTSLMLGRFLALSGKVPTEYAQSQMAHELSTVENSERKTHVA